MRLRTLAAAAATALVLSTGVALAGEQYVDPTGFAISGYDVVSYWSLEQAPVGEAQPAPAVGNPAYTAEFNGATWAFSSAANRDLFLEDPARYVPAYDGHCAYGVALEGKVPGNPLLWRIVDDTLFLNITSQVVQFWEADIPGFVDKSETNWTPLEPKPAATNPVPQFDYEAAIRNAS